MKKVTKAIILAAGLGTRMLPAAKAVPKEMLPIVDKPAIQYLVEEASNSGITDILIVTNREKHSIENHFDYSPEYESVLKNRRGGESIIENFRYIASLANVHYIRQKQPKGTGHAVLCAKSFVGDDNFVMIYGDDVITSETPVIKQMIDTYDKYGMCVASVKEVEREKLRLYCSLKVKPIEDSSNEFYVYDMNEKPQADSDIYSNYAILGRVLLTPEIFPILENQGIGVNNEIQLTDAMKTLVRRSAEHERAMMAARVFEGERHDIGSKLGFLRANVMEGVKHSEIGEELKKFLKEFIKEL